MAASDTSKEAAEVIIVTGAGRSGTSTVAGTLSQLGFHVPQPEVQGNKANPRGHFEPRWVVDFDTRVLNSANVDLVDSRPDALERVSQATVRNPHFRAELLAWLSGQLEEHRRLVIKDPRAFWCRDLWLDVAGELGVRTGFLTMLRHPAEVVGSRDMHYYSKRSAEERAILEVSNVAEWVNASLLNELGSRDQRRVFVRYTDLLEDWRSTMGRVGSALGVDFDDALSQPEHPVDDFIDAGLHRSKITWADMAIPDELRDQAEEVWQILSQEHGAEGLSADAQARLDQLREAYRGRYHQSVAFALDHTRAAERMARWKTKRAMSNRAKTAEARAQQASDELSALRARLQEQQARASRAPAARARRLVRRVVRRARTARQA